MKLSYFHHFILFIILTSFLISCGSSFDSQISLLALVKDEEELCNQNSNYPDGVSIVGFAKFEKRTIEVTTEEVINPGPPLSSEIKLKNMSLSDPLPNALPIKFAEVSVYNSKNQLVQCGTTSETGELKATDFTSTLKIPSAAGTYKVRVTSRSFRGYNNNPNEFSHISIKQDKYKNQLHEISEMITSQGSPVMTVNLTAKARQSDSVNVEAGAFNILNSLLTAYDYIKEETNGTDTSCLSSKLNVFWKAGFNPVQYNLPDSDPQTLSSTSFYLNETNELYITGGQLGDVSISNTDHFDDFAIIHEFGHFTEDVCGQWTSAGGDHFPVKRMDPRLAWSEGWANYLAANIIKSKINELDYSLTEKLSVLKENLPTNYGWTYFFNSNGISDSVQNIGNGDGWFIDFRKSGSDPGAATFAPYTGQEYDKVLPTTYPGEGHVREAAISRGLFKVSNTCGVNCASTAVDFEFMWKSFNKITGIGASEKSFISSDQFVEKLKNILTTNWHESPLTSAITPREVFDSEAMQAVSDGIYGTSPLKWPGYGRNLRAGGAPCSLSIQPRSDNSLNNSASDPRYSNHFYTINPSLLPGLAQISVQFNRTTGSNVDHDLIVFKPNYFFNDDYICNNPNGSSCESYTPFRSTSSDIITMNREPALTLSTSYSKNIILTGLELNQQYLLDIRAWTAGLSINSSTEYSYTINSNLGLLCPE